jgi:hypothetical protein
MTAGEKYELCLRVYNDIINGYTLTYFDKREVYVKHLRDVDYALFEQKREIFKQQASEKGLLSEQENLEMLDKTGHWSKLEEEKYQQLIAEIKNLNKTHDQIFLESQKKIIADRIDKKQKEMREMSKHRDLVPLNNLEKFANEKLNLFIMKFCLYKDRKFDEHLFTEKEFDELDTETVTKYATVYFSSLNLFNDKNIQRVGALGTFLNAYMLCSGNPYYFFGKKISNLTTYQVRLSGYGNSFKNTLEHSESTPPISEDIDEMISWYERERESIRRRYSGNSKPAKSQPSDSKTERLEGIAIPNASKEELETLGAENKATPINLVEAAEKLKKKLGKDELNIRDMVELHK